MTSNDPAVPFGRIGIIGGGTAGYLTALSIRALRPEISVTLIESSKIPIIGVGEATTSEIIPYLHHFLKLDIHSFFTEVQPTWKLGIRFEWGAPPPTSFNYPFDSGSILESLVYDDGDLSTISQMAGLMAADRFPLLRSAAGARSLLWRYPFAYHLDNRRFVSYLKKHVGSAGVIQVDAEIVDAPLTEEGDFIEKLVASDAREFKFDLYIDCTGFASYFLEKRLRSPYVSYASSLFADSAVVAARPHHGHLRPYTTAETMNHGWCWNIPQVEEDHRGYVFSSAFCTVEEAAAEMRRKNPEMGDYWSLRFRSGRHEHFWKGNVVAIGNSYGFVEPLESTAIQVVLHENLLLLKHLPSSLHDIASIEKLNRKMAACWDYIRWFLSVHYRFNQRLSTPFWEECRRSVDTSGADWLVDRYRSACPLSRGSHSNEELSAPTFNSFGYDILLAGQGITGVLYEPAETAEQYCLRRDLQRSITNRTVTQSEGLQMLQQHPEFLDEFVTSPHSWVARVAHYLDFKVSVN